ncbi:acyl-CoA dehydrogenase family protein [Nocardia macrotermitis]|uniref:Acyl-CoA dehydrogenase n=1 Tax=Nocardia macrotermitis TaxID=2585198 RepID=A0A7K0DAC0_9NOCA|nr:acyl-CoA dehydrogenase family protein [Nocardia macrotermitis]MQY22618.1 hypothetical protein [Nocardia macrotermitis]
MTLTTGHDAELLETDARLRAMLAEFGQLRIEADDEADAFPVAIWDRLNALGIQRFYIPSTLGGALADYESSARLTRTMARHDVTVAVAHGKTYLGAVCTWIAGTDAQQRWLAEIIARGVPVSWALTERDHGSDLTSGEMCAEPVEGGYRLDGEKWLINNASKGGVVCVLARTGQGGGFGGFGLFLIDKRTVRPDEFTALAKESTHGIRGADISGFRARGLTVPADARVGADGHGLEIVARALQSTRTMCAYLSLGAADHALALAVSESGELPVDGFAAQLAGEALATVAARGIQALPGDQAALSAAVKYLVPTIVEDLIRDLRRQLGPWALVAGHGTGGTMAKVERDHRIVSLFDGNTLVNLHALISNFPILLWRSPERTAEDLEGLRVCTTLAQPLPDFDGDRLTLRPRRGAGVLAGLPDALERLGEDHALVAAEVDQLRAALTELTETTRALDRHAVSTPAEAFTAAARLCVLMGAAAAVHLWVNNRDDPMFAEDELWTDALWLRLALHALCERLGARRPLPTSVRERAARILRDQVGAGEPISFLFRARTKVGR